MFECVSERERQREREREKERERRGWFVSKQKAESEEGRKKGVGRVQSMSIR